MGAIFHNGDYVGSVPPIDDSSISDKKLWSSKKTQDVIDSLSDVIDISSTITNKATGINITGSKIGNTIQLSLGGSVTDGLANATRMFTISKKHIYSASCLIWTAKGIGRLTISGANGDAMWYGTNLAAGDAVNAIMMYLTTD
jgi:hypothetical protein